MTYIVDLAIEVAIKLRPNKLHSLALYSPFSFINTKNFWKTKFNSHYGVYLENGLYEEFLVASDHLNYKVINLSIFLGCNNLSYKLIKPLSMRDKEALLIDAIKYSNLQVTAFLVYEGVDLDQNREILYYITDDEILEFLLANGAQLYDIGSSMLLQAISDQNTGLVRVLLENGVNPNDHEGIAFILAISYSPVLLDMLFYFGGDINSVAGQNLVARMQHKGGISLLDDLIENGFDINSNDSIMLIIACKKYNIFIIEALIVRGADINVRNGKPLLLAIRRQNYGLVEFLLANGADIHAKEDQALIEAIKYHNKDIIDLLLYNGANLHAQNDLSLRLAAGTEVYHYITEYL